MHYLTLVTVDFPKVECEPEEDKRIFEQIEALKADNTEKHSYLSDFYLQYFNSISNAFGRRVDSEIFMALEPYNEQTEDPDYLEFEDYTEELREEYESGSVDCIKLPESKIVSIDNQRVWNKFIVGDDGKVYQKEFGPLKHPKRSKRAKQMKAIKNYPYCKLYKTFDEFVQRERYYDYNEEYEGYGYTYNPNAFYDWYSIGGRWPFLFLVKDTCEEFSVGERSWCIDEERLAPTGYRWVCAARKRNIQWKVMFKYRKECAVKQFHMLEQAFAEKKLPEEYIGTFTDEGISRFGEMLYIKGETVQQYLVRNRIVKKYKYPIFVYGYLDRSGCYQEKDTVCLMDINKRDRVWRKMLNKFIDSLSDETVLVGVDCHI